MDQPINQRPYRDNVGIVVFNQKGLVLAGDRVQYPGHFQFPQGGIEPDESPLDAAKRELFEETGLHLFKPAGEATDWLYYEFPDDIPDHLKKYRGQRQKWFFFRWDGDPATLKPDENEQEFLSLQWMQLDELVSQIIPFKRQVYNEVSAMLQPILTAVDSSPATIVLEYQNFGIGLGSYRLCEDISIQVNRGEILGLIGESGCGKSITALAATGSLPSPGGKAMGEVIFHGANKAQSVFAMADEELRQMRGAEISVIFQEPGQALNPLLTIERQLTEIFKFHPEQTKHKNINPTERISSLLSRVGFSDHDRILASYPHELSGGMLQRIVIVMALLLKPALIIADEPTTALDVTVQAQIMQLLVELKEEENCAILLISHNMGLMAQYADRLAVMYAGRIVEESPVSTFLSKPAHPYSQGLLAAIPDPETKHALKAIEGQVPTPSKYDDGCRFRNRCAKAFEPCHLPVPTVRIAPNHRVDCWLYVGGAVAGCGEDSSQDCRFHACSSRNGSYGSRRMDGNRCPYWRCCCSWRCCCKCYGKFYSC